MTINQIVRNTVERLKAEGKVWTPDVYSEIFCAEAKKAGFAVEDCSGIDRFTPLMDKKTQDEVKQYRVKTAHELIRFLISKLSRLNPSEASVLVETLSSLAQVMAKGTDLLHNHDASSLAKKTIAILETQGGKTQIELLKQAWENFVTVYDDTFLTKLAQFGDVDKQNLKKTVEGLSGEASTTDGFDYTQMASLIILGLSPSIAPQMNDDLSKLAHKVHEDPRYIAHATFDNEIKSAIAMRIALDKKSVNEMIRSLDELLGKLSAQLIDLIERSDVSSVEIKSIKKDLESLGIDKTSDFKTAHKRLYTIASALEEKVEVLSKDLKSHNEQVVQMGTRITTLEAELAEANQASREDFLTKLYNKRALDEFLALKEADYERHGRHYCIAMFDLDHFKAVNDTYGHDAGDMVLKAFARILKEEGRTNDIIGRFGGEEFLAILGDTNLEGAKNFANKVRQHVEEARFMYQERRINLTVSVGIAERSNYASLNNAIVGADEQLYTAKKKGVTASSLHEFRLFSLRETSFYEEIDVRRFPRIYASIKEQLPLPQIIHLVGTNGKGSTGRFLVTALHRAGKKVGHYTSPHILAFNERLWIDGGEISNEALESAHQKLYGILDSQSRDALSYFEYTTLLSLIAFDGCDYIVCEAGLGGEFDATNAFEKVLSIFTPIDFDHAAFLGTTIESIAGTKLRSMNTKALLAKQPHIQTKSIARRIADEKGSLLMCIDEMCRDEIVEMALQIAIKNSLSDYLRDNLELSMVAFEILGYRVESQLFDQNALFGRLSRITPNITLDVGHNALAAEAIARFYEERKVTLIYNTYADKDYREILSILKPIIESVEIIEVNEGRIVERSLLESVLRELEIPFSVFDALHEDKEYLVFGSFSVAETFLKREK